MNLDRFKNLWNRCAGFTDPESTAIFRALDKLYHESNRFYHTDAHIDHCLVVMDKASRLLGRSDIVELSIWFHDAIYIPGSPDNEASSVKLFSDLARDSLPKETVSSVSSCILSTTHKKPPKDESSKFVVDVDLSGFGQDWEGFNRDGENIRKENAHISDEDFVTGQINFMENLQNRNQIYSTEFFITHFESSARRNISRQLDIYYQLTS